MENEEEKKLPEDAPPPDHDNVEKVPPEDQPPLDPGEEDGVKVKVINPFKPGVRISRVIRQGKCYYHPAKPASYLCASCGKSICTICGTDINGTYFCPMCTPVPSPSTPALPPPESKPPDTSWIKPAFAIGIIFILIGAILVVAYWPLSSISAAEFDNLQKEYDEGDPLNNIAPGTNFPIYRPGDTITIRDTIARRTIQTNDSTFGTLTLLWFESTGIDDEDFWLSFDADLERDYHVGDEVVITLHVEEHPRFHHEIIKELDNDRPDITNIDHTLSTNLVFYSIILIGILLVAICAVSLKKARDLKARETE
jgi:hypothetical protein